jgi:hypothetical protein
MSPPQVSPIQDLGDEHELNSGYRMAGLDASIALNVMQALKDGNRMSDCLDKEGLRG